MQTYKKVFVYSILALAYWGMFGYLEPLFAWYESEFPGNLNSVSAIEAISFYGYSVALIVVVVAPLALTYIHLERPRRD